VVEVEPCPNQSCEPIKNWGLKNITPKDPGIEANKNIKNNLTQLDNNLFDQTNNVAIPAIITAAHGPGHKDPCHLKYGTCIDIVPKNKSSCNNWFKLGTALAQSGAKSIILEYKDEPKFCDGEQANKMLCDGSRPWTCKKNKDATGVHFHVFY